jgi:hypothetical protein
MRGWSLIEVVVLLSITLIFLMALFAVNINCSI